MAPAGGFDQGWSVNDPCFYKDEARGWILGRVTKVVGVGRTATLSLASTDGKVTAGGTKRGSCVGARTRGRQTWSRSTSSRRRRAQHAARPYDRKQIYTNVGGILAAVNPYETIANVYGEDRMRRCRRRRGVQRRGRTRHGRAGAAGAGPGPRGAVASDLASRARADRGGQVHPALPVVARRASSSGTPGRRGEAPGSVLLSNPVLEPGRRHARNDNSSLGQPQGEPSSGAIKSVGITAYLLEKVRVEPRGEELSSPRLVAAPKNKKGDAGLAFAVGLGDAQTKDTPCCATRRPRRGDRRGRRGPVRRDARRPAVLDAQPPPSALAPCHLGDVCFESVEAEARTPRPRSRVRTCGWARSTPRTPRRAASTARSSRKLVAAGRRRPHARRRGGRARVKRARRYASVAGCRARQRRSRP